MGDSIKRDKKKAESLLSTAARALGSVAGSVASSIGVHGEAAPATARAKSHGRLPKKDKSRLPRRQKKALRKTEKARVGAS